MSKIPKMLDAVRRVARREERDRIIALLEALENDERNRGGDWIEMPITEVVALIKGEN